MFVPECRYEKTLALSPDGTAVASSNNASGQYNVWLHFLSGAPARQLTKFTDRAVRQVAFSSDGKTLVFSADHDGDELRQIYTVPVAGGRPDALTTAKACHFLAAAPFSPDGTKIVAAVNDRDPGVQDIVVRDRTPGGEPSRFKGPADLVVEPAGFAPDGRRLLVWGLHASTDTDLFLLDLDDRGQWGGRLECVTAHQGDEQHLPGPWAPDGSGFYEITDAGRDHKVLVLHDLADGPGRPVSTPRWDAEQSALSADGSTLAWTVNQDGISVLEVRRGGRDVALPHVPAGQISALAVSRDGRRLAFLLDSAARPAEVCAVDLDEGTFGYLTDNRPPALAGGRAGSGPPEPVRYRAHDGREIPAFQYRPAGTGPFPVVLSVHGGPEDQERPTYRYAGLYQYLLAAGVAVLAPNVRGSTGYGAAYQRLIHRDWGGDELRDLEQAAHYLRQQPWADSGRIAVFGGSYGGFAALSCLSRLPRYWAAGVSVAGQSDLVTFARSVPPTWRPLMARWVGDPDADAEMLTARSPLTYADRIVAPLFVIQGARDPRVNRAESDRLVAGLRARGVEVRYDVYEDEGHGFTRRENEIRAWSDVGSFLVTALKGQL
ncbi:S9 family peptidase [Streptomyces sp. NPDC002599]|uniref:S9 family peptidase n=1 Tax=Streptomyces sp. NPDC002599 TaxID=3154421 RepID=UPI0033320515